MFYIKWKINSECFLMKANHGLVGKSIIVAKQFSVITVEWHVVVLVGFDDEFDYISWKISKWPFLVKYYI